MEQLNDEIEKTKTLMVNAEQRLLRQRRRVEKLLVDRHPADEAQAQLLILEQSLLALARHLSSLVAAPEFSGKGGKRKGKPTTKPAPGDTLNR